MRANIAADLGLAVDDVNIKAKTAEKLGFVGRGEGIVAEVVALISRSVAQHPAGPTTERSVAMPRPAAVFCAVAR